MAFPRVGPPEEGHIPKTGLLEFLLGDGYGSALGVVETQTHLRLARQPPAVYAVHPSCGTAGKQTVVVGTINHRSRIGTSKRPFSQRQDIVRTNTGVIALMGLLLSCTRARVVELSALVWTIKMYIKVAEA